MYENVTRIVFLPTNRRQAIVFGDARAALARMVVHRQLISAVRLDLGVQIAGGLAPWHGQLAGMREWVGRWLANPVD